MKELTEEEFQDRISALARAGRIFPDVMNISERFKIYQEVFAEREREIFLTTQIYGNKPKTIMDKYERIPCDVCGSDLMFRLIPENPDGIRTQLVCNKCSTVLDSKMSLEEWMKNLKVKTENLRG